MYGMYWAFGSDGKTELSMTRKPSMLRTAVGPIENWPSMQYMQSMTN